MISVFGIILNFLAKHSGEAVFLKGFALFSKVFVYWPMEFWVQAGMLLIAVKLAASKKVWFQDLFPPLNRTLKYMAGYLMVGVVSCLGLLLFIVPGIVWGIKFQFVPYLMADKLLPLSEAFGVSAKMTDGLKWKLFRYAINCCGVILLGLVAFCIGLWWAVIVVQIATAYVYRALLLQTNRRLALKQV